MIGARAMDENYGAWEAEFRRSGKDRQFNEYIAVRRLHIALLGLGRTIMDPRTLSKMMLTFGALTLLMAFFGAYGDWEGMAPLIALAIGFGLSAVFLKRLSANE
jgi:hypothetical protein